MAEPGYLLSLAPVLSLAAAFHHGQERRSGVRWVEALCHLSFGAASFLFAHPWSGAQIGDGTTYAKKSLTQKARTELNARAFRTWYAIRQADAQLAAFREAVGRECGADDHSK